VKVEYRQSFTKDIQKLGDATVRKRVASTIGAVKSAASLDNIAGVKKIQGHSGYYRIRISDYRIGVFVDGEIVTFVCCLHRKDIYRHFP